MSAEHFTMVRCILAQWNGCPADRSRRLLKSRPLLWPDSDRYWLRKFVTLTESERSAPIPRSSVFDLFRLSGIGSQCRRVRISLLFLLFL